MKVKTEVEVGVTLDVYVDISRSYPMTRHSPAEPESIEEIRLFYKEQELKGEVLDFFLKEFEREINDAIWMQVWEDQYEEALSEAEHLKDLEEMR